MSQQDEFHGIGGSYVVNEKSGLRELQHRTEPAPDTVAENQPVTENEDGSAQA